MPPLTLALMEPARADDALLRACADYVCKFRAGAGDDPAAMAEKFRRALVFVLARDGEGRIVGMANGVGHPCAAPDGRPALVISTGILLEPEWRGRGVAERLALLGLWHVRRRHWRHRLYLHSLIGQYRSYRLLLRNFPATLPRPGHAQSAAERTWYSQAHALVTGEAPAPGQCIVPRHPLQLDEARQPVAGDVLRRSATARRFLALNPGYAEGDLLICLSECRWRDFLRLPFVALRQRLGLYPA